MSIFMDEYNDVRAWPFVTAIILCVFGSVYLFGSFSSVSAGHKGVQTRFGKVQEEVLSEGLHYVGFFTGVHEMTTQTQKIQIDSDAASKDLQSVKATIAVNLHLDPLFVKDTYQQLTMEYTDTIVNPAVEESVKAVTARFTADEMIAKREQVKQGIAQELKTRLEPRHLAVEDVLIVNFSFSDQFNKAIESKQSAEQEAQKAERDLERIKTEAQQKIEQAKAEAESLRIQKQEISPEMLQLRWIEKWNGQVPQYWGQTNPFIGIK